jgi:hypothetical protein
LNYVIIKLNVVTDAAFVLAERQVIVVEYLVDSGAEALEADCLMFAVVLDIADLCRLVGDVKSKTIFIPGTEYENFALTKIALYMTIEPLGEGYGIVAAVDDYIEPQSAEILSYFAK